MKYSFLLFVFIFSAELYAQTSTYTVTASTMGSENSLDKILEDAVTDADLGYDVTIYLNVPGGLIPVPSEQIIDNSSGSITIEKHPSANAVQGLDGIDLDGAHAIGIKITSAVNITIRNLHFENFRFSNDLAQSAIFIEDSRNTLITKNNFVNNDNGILIWDSEQVIVSDNSFEDQFRDAISYEELVAGGSGLSGNSGIYFVDNTIFFTHYASPSGNYDGIVCLIRERNDKLKIYIENNDIDIGKEGIQIFNEIGTGHGLLFFIRSNRLIYNELFPHSSSQGMILNGPLPNWEVTGNRIEGSYYGIGLAELTKLGETIVPNDFSIDFIAENTLGYTPINTGNEIVNCIYSFSSQLSIANYIVGYDVEGIISVPAGYNTTIREVKIEHSIIYSDIPILSPEGASSNDLISLTGATYLDGLLTVTTTVSGTPADGKNYILDVYGASDNGDLLSYLGNQTITGDVTDHTITLSDALLSYGKIGVTLTSLGDVGGTRYETSEVEYIQIEEKPCESCNSFSPKPNGIYWLSAWVQVNNEESEQYKTYYNELTGPFLELVYFGSGTNALFYPSGEIIDGWQRIVGKLTIPEETSELLVVLNSSAEGDTYFDDIRIHPFNGSMKSYVYDGETFWLTSELDDNNYATFYEYDQEGGLVRIKKETSRGIVTIQETRSNTLKQDDEEE